MIRSNKSSFALMREIPDFLIIQTEIEIITTQTLCTNLETLKLVTPIHICNWLYM